ncbi:tRNA3(Ser)-specific nuclease WapA precursor [compost metagenome]
MQDALGSTLGLVEKDGRVSSRYHYDEFGTPLDAKKFDLNWPGPDNLFGYTGLGYDFASSNTYARARYYEPEIGRFISEDTYKGDIWNPQSQNLYAYVENNPLIYVDPTGFAAALIGYVYIIEGTYEGEIETYVGSTAQDIKRRMGNHKWKEIVQHPDSTVKAIEVTADLDIKGSGRGTYFSARNEALRAAEQEVINKYRMEGIKLKNVDDAATAKNLPIWKSRHSVSFAMNSAKLALKGGNRINSAIGVFDIYKTAMDLRRSQYEYAPYYMQDEGGVFTIGYSKGGWFSKTKYHKTYQSGPSQGNKINIDKEEYKFWKAEGEALWGYLDAWGNFVPGLLNPVLPSSDIVI